MPEILDDKSPHCIPFILDRIKAHRDPYVAAGKTPPPFFVGLNGVQGAGKTTLAVLTNRASKMWITRTQFQHILSSPPHSHPTVVLSIDDLYLRHSHQVALATSHPSNPLVQHRGQPSTHDVALGTSLFQSLADRDRDVRIPSYDKSAFSGQGDQRPESEWEIVNCEGEPSVDVVLFEGWCVGFRALSEQEAVSKWRQAQHESEVNGEDYHGQLGKLEWESVRFVNTELEKYAALTDRLAAFMHIDAEDIQYVYAWRLEQEAALRNARGTGMTDKQVVKFVNGYYPAYELYTDVLRAGIFPDAKGKQIRLVVGRDRRVKAVHIL